MLLLLLAHTAPPTPGSRRSAAAAGDAAARMADGPPLHAVTRLAGPAAAEGGHPTPLPFPPPAVNDALLRAVVDACAQRKETYIYVHGSEAAVVASADFVSSVSARPCPPVDIMLGADHRSIGLCTDAAIYIHLLGARLLPGPAALPLAAYAAACPPSGTARLSLEAVHEEWVTGASPGVDGGAPGGAGGGGAAGSEGGAARGAQVLSGGVRIFAPNFENVYASDEELHKQMQLVLCKVRRCVDLFTPYLRDLGSKARVIFTGHTAIDPAPVVDGGAAARRPRQPPDFGAFLHVRGKSELKHTAELLACWGAHPDWPKLTVLGPLPNPQINLTAAKKYLAAPNIAVSRPGIPDGPNWPLFDPAPPAELAQLQLSVGIHICPSEREGYGLYISEARAAGALVIAPDWPPMNELVTPATGVLIPPDRTFSQPGPPLPALGRYGNISASVSPEAICAAVARALAMTPADRAARGAAARAAFEAERAALLARMTAVRAQISALLSAQRAPAARLKAAKGLMDT